MNKTEVVLVSMMSVLIFLMVVFAWGYDLRRIENAELRSELFECQNAVPYLSYFDSEAREICLEKRDNCIILHGRCYCIWDNWTEEGGEKEK